MKANPRFDNSPPSYFEWAARDPSPTPHVAHSDKARREAADILACYETNLCLAPDWWLVGIERPKP